MRRSRLFCGKTVLFALSLIFTGVGIGAQEPVEGLNIMELTLNQAIDIALSDNPTVRIAEQQIELKKISDTEMWQNLLPSADFSGNVNYTVKAAVMKLNDMEFKMGQDNTSTWNGQFSVSLPVFAPTVYATMNLTETDIEQAVEQSRSSRLDLINQVTRAYYQLILAQDSYDVLEKSFLQSEKNFEVVNSMFQLGLVSEYDKISAEVQMRSLKPSVISTKNGVNLAKLQLKVLMGVTVDVEIGITDCLNNYENEIYPEVLFADNYSLENNTTIRQLMINEKMLNQSLHVQKMSFMPTLALVGSYSFQSLYNDNLKVFDYSWVQSSLVALSLSVPLFRAGNFTKLRSSKIQISQLRENRLYTERQLDMQARSFINNMKASSEQMASNREAIAQAQKGREIAEKRYEVGKGTILELNISEVSLTQAKLIYSQSIYDYLVAKSDLDKVLGKEYEILGN